MKHIALCALLLSFANSAWSAGYQLRYQGAETMGTAFASAGSYGDSLSSIYYNPGLFLMQDKDRAVSLELMMIHPTKAEFKSSTGATEDDYASTSISGGIYYGLKIDDESAFTLAITTPWGTATDYDENWDGRYQALETDLAAINIQPMLTKKVNDKFTFSVGPQIQYMTGAISSTTAQLVPPPAPPGTTVDSIGKFDGNSWSVGGVLALTYLPTEKTTVGFNYTSQVKHSLRGDLDITVGGNSVNNFNDANTEIVTPDVFTLGVSHDISDRLVGHFSASYTNWSLFKNLNLKSGVNSLTVLDQNWDDTYMLAAGTTFNMSESTTLRGGVSYETGAVDNADRTPRSQDTDRIGLGFGASLPIGGVSLDLAINHIIYTGDIELDIPADPTSGNLQGVKGEYDNAATLLRVGVEYVF